MDPNLSVVPVSNSANKSFLEEIKPILAGKDARTERVVDALIERLAMVEADLKGVKAGLFDENRMNCDDSSFDQIVNLFSATATKRNIDALIVAALFFSLDKGDNCKSVDINSLYRGLKIPKNKSTIKWESIYNFVAEGSDKGNNYFFLLFMKYAACLDKLVKPMGYNQDLAKCCRMLRDCIVKGAVARLSGGKATRPMAKGITIKIADIVGVFSASHGQACLPTNDKNYSLLVNNAKNIIANFSDYISPSDKAKINYFIDEKSFATMRIGFFGSSGAGKSTLINTLLGFDLLEEGFGQTTKCVLEIKKCNSSFSSGMSVINYYSDEEICSLAQSLRPSIVPIFNDPRAVLNSSNRTAWLNEISDAFQFQIKPSHDTISFRNLLLSLDKYQAFLGMSIQKNWEEARAFASDDVYASLVKSIHVYHDSASLDFCELVDIPGLGSSYGRHTQIATSATDSIDVVAYVMKYDHRLFGDDLCFLNQLRCFRRGHQKVVYVITQTSLIKSGWDPDKGVTQKNLIDKIVRDTESKLIEMNLLGDIFAVDSIVSRLCGKIVEANGDCASLILKLEANKFIDCSGSDFDGQYDMSGMKRLIDYFFLKLNKEIRLYKESLFEKDLLLIARQIESTVNGLKEISSSDKSELTCKKLALEQAKSLLLRAQQQCSRDAEKEVVDLFKGRTARERVDKIRVEYVQFAIKFVKENCENFLHGRSILEKLIGYFNWTILDKALECANNEIAISLTSFDQWLHNQYKDILVNYKKQIDADLATLDFFLNTDRSIAEVFETPVDYAVDCDFSHTFEIGLWDKCLNWLQNVEVTLTKKLDSESVHKNITQYFQTKYDLHGQKISSKLREAISFICAIQERALIERIGEIDNKDLYLSTLDEKYTALTGALQEMLLEIGSSRS